MQELIERLNKTDPRAFPYHDVIEEYHRVGKHFVPHRLLRALDGVRNRKRQGTGPEYELLIRFLNCALDKWDDRYFYPTYTALDLLPIPGGVDPAAALRHRDRLVLLLVTDAIRFEHAAADERTELLPRMRPDDRTVEKRCRLGLRAIRPIPERYGVDPAGTATDVVAASREVCDRVRATLTPDERLMLKISMLPVDIVHDEYLFIRVLQSFEATFALLAVLLRTGIRTISEGAVDTTLDCLATAESTLRRAAPLFSLLATMQVGSFQLFREFTEGASAIQSSNYKIVEALCRKPTEERLESPAYQSVPDVRVQVVDGMQNLDQALQEATESGRLDDRERGRVVAAMHRFGSVLAQWRKTHYSLAVRMLGDRSGTGYTQGTPYLHDVLSIPVFETAEEDDR